MGEIHTHTHTHTHIHTRIAYTHSHIHIPPPTPITYVLTSFLDPYHQKLKIIYRQASKDYHQQSGWMDGWMGGNDIIIWCDKITCHNKIPIIYTIIVFFLPSSLHSTLYVYIVSE